MRIKIIDIIEEQAVLQTTKTKPIVDAIKKRNPITFFYSGPRKPSKESVKAGTRVRAEAVAIGVSQKGNLIIRAHVQPPSVSKKGFKDNGWRTFMVGRMSAVNVMTDETFNEKRPGYKEGPESGGPMVKTYVTSNWGDEPETNDEPVQTPDVQPAAPVSTTPPIQKPTVSNTPSELPQIKKEKKPTEIPTNPEDTRIKDLYKQKQNTWINKQKEVGGNLKPGEGTRNRLKRDSKSEIEKMMADNNLPQEQPELNEMMKRFKSLIIY